MKHLDINGLSINTHFIHGDHLNLDEINFKSHFIYQQKLPVLPPNGIEPDPIESWTYQECLPIPNDDRPSFLPPLSTHSGWQFKYPLDWSRHPGFHRWKELYEEKHKILLRRINTPLLCEDQFLILTNQTNLFHVFGNPPEGCKSKRRKTELRSQFITYIWESKEVQEHLHNIAILEDQMATYSFADEFYTKFRYDLSFGALQHSAKLNSSYDEGEDSHQSVEHHRMCQFMLQLARESQIRFYPRNVGIKGYYAMADMLFVGNNGYTFIEVLSDHAVIDPDRIRNKVQLANHHPMIFVVGPFADISLLREKGITEIYVTDNKEIWHHTSYPGITCVHCGRKERHLAQAGFTEDKSVICVKCKRKLGCPICHATSVHSEKGKLKSRWIGSCSRCKLQGLCPSCIEGVHILNPNEKPIITTKKLTSNKLECIKRGSYLTFDSIATKRFLGNLKRAGFPTIDRHWFLRKITNILRDNSSWKPNITISNTHRELLCLRCHRKVPQKTKAEYYINKKTNSLLNRLEKLLPPKKNGTPRPLKKPWLHLITPGTRLLLTLKGSHMKTSRYYGLIVDYYELTTKTPCLVYPNRDRENTGGERNTPANSTVCLPWSREVSQLSALPQNTDVYLEVDEKDKIKILYKPTPPPITLNQNRQDPLDLRAPAEKNHL